MFACFFPPFIQSCLIYKSHEDFLSTVPRMVPQANSKCFQMLNKFTAGLIAPWCYKAQIKCCYFGFNSSSTLKENSSCMQKALHSSSEIF